MNLDPALLEIIVCPDCRGALAVDEAAARAGLHRLRAGLPGPRRHPVLLVDEARRPEQG